MIWLEGVVPVGGKLEPSRGRRKRRHTRSGNAATSRLDCCRVAGYLFKGRHRDDRSGKRWISAETRKRWDMSGLPVFFEGGGGARSKTKQQQ